MLQGCQESGLISLASGFSGSSREIGQGSCLATPCIAPSLKQLPTGSGRNVGT